MRRDVTGSRLQALGLVVALLPLSACATRVSLPPLPDCHPSSTAAPSAERARPSGLLDRVAPVPVAEPEVLEETEGMGEMEPMEETGERGEMEEMEGHEHHEMHPPDPPPPPPPPASGGTAP